jgi:hypothetical protein
MLRVFEVETPEGTEWLLSNDPHAVTELVQATGWTVIADHDPAAIIACQYQGIARLSTC